MSETKESVRELINQAGWLPLVTIVGVMLLPIAVMLETTTDPALLIRHIIPSVTVILLGAAMFASKERKEWSGRLWDSVKRPVSIAFLALVLVKVVSLTVALNLVEGLFDLASSLLCYLLLILFQALLSKHRQSTVTWFTLGIITLNTALIVFGIHGFWQVNFEWVQMAEVGSQLVNQNLFAPMFLLSIPFLLISLESGKSRYLLWSLVILDVLMVIALQNRATYLALLGGGTVYIGLQVFLGCNGVRPLWVRVAFLSVVLVGMVAGVAKMDEVTEGSEILFNSNAELAENYNSITERYMLWNRTAQMFADHPVIGVGAGNWPLRIGEYGAADPRDVGGTKYFIRPHNELLRIASELGFLGLIILFIMMVMVIRSFQRNILRASTKAVAGGLVAFGVVCLFSFPTERVPIMVLVLLMMAMLSVENEAQPVTRNASPFVPIGLLLCGAILTLFFFVRIKNDMIAKKMDDARNLDQWGRVGKLAEKIDPNFYNVNYFRVPIGYYSGLSVYYENDLEKALELFADGVKRNPNHVLTISNLATCYSQLEQDELAIPLFEKALVVNPYFEQARVNLAIANYRLGRFEEAWEHIQKCSEPPQQVYQAIQAQLSYNSVQE